MTAFEIARENMVKSQIRTNDVHDPRLLKAFYTVPREVFVPASQRSLSYIDDNIQVVPADGRRPARYLLAPMVLAKLIELASPTASDLVLDVGCTTGYSTAILAHLAESVVALECDEELVSTATENLAQLSIDNAAVVQGALEEGYPAEGPYDVILLNGCVEEVPEALLSLLSEGGRLVAVICPEGLAYDEATGMAWLYRKSNGSVNGAPMFTAGAPLLPGFEREVGFAF